MTNTSAFDEDTQRVLITQAMGEALGAWARVEEELSLVFVHAIGAALDNPARAVFYSVRSFEARLGMTQAAISAMWPALPPDTLGQEWNALYNRLRVKNKSRNEIAHAGILGYSQNGGPVNVCVDPYLNVTSGRLLPEDKNFRTIKQIKETAQGFISAALRISAFELDLAWQLRRHPTSILRANYPDPEVRESANQKMQELAKLLQPSGPSPQSDE